MTENNNLTVTNNDGGGFGLVPQNITEALKVSELLSKSNLVPKQFKGKPEDVFVVLQCGAELGLGPMQALQGIACINGRPSIYGDAAVALVLNSGLLEHHEEYYTIDGRKLDPVDDLDEIRKLAADKARGLGAVVETRRRGEENNHRVVFTIGDAIKAGLLGKSGPWQDYTERMLMWRARSWNFRDKFADVLKGLSFKEEVQDFKDFGKKNEVITADFKEPKPKLKIKEPDNVSGPTTAIEPTAVAEAHPLDPETLDPREITVADDGKLEFKIAGRQYRTNGVTPDTLLAVWNICREFDKQFGKGEFKQKMINFTGVESSVDLDEEQARMLIAAAKIQMNAENDDDE